MLKVLVFGIAALVAGMSPAHAVDENQAIERWHDAQYVCKMGEARDGSEVSDEAVDTSCREREAIGRELLKDHYCWSQGEQEWYPIGQDNGFCEIRT